MLKPQYYNYHTNDGIHAAMKDYAASFNKSSLVALVKFKDGEELIEEFERATKEVFYRVYDKDEGLYSINVHTSKYKAPFLSAMDLTCKELKEGYVVWLKEGEPAGFTITWSRGGR